VLQITHDAAELITALRRGQDVPDDHGLRIYAEASEPGEITVALGFTDSPAAGDQVTEQDGLKVFVAPEVAEPLQDAAIDVTPADDGAQRLVFRPQGEVTPT
jgi:Fe-S cluster assembly iron-binding protein IscA